MKTMITLILDRSGSMAGRESDVIGGVNRFIDEQKGQPGEACMAMVRFDSEAIERWRPMVNLREVNPMRANEFRPRGMTPLHDALGRTIAALDSDWLAEKPDQAIVIIVTDGQENHSTEYTKEKVRKMIEAREASGKWQFIYLGTEVNAFHEASSVGIAAKNTANFSKTTRGFSAAMGSMSASTAQYRATGQTMNHLDEVVKTAERDVDDGFHVGAAGDTPAGLGGLGGLGHIHGVGGIIGDGPASWTPPLAPIDENVAVGSSLFSDPSKLKTADVWQVPQ